MAEHGRKMLQYNSKLAMARERSRVPPVLDQTNGNNDEAHQLTSQELLTLRTYPLPKKCDRKFMRTLLKLMYRGNLHELQHRVLKRTTKCDPQSKIITPEKLDKIYSLMAERAAKIQDTTEMPDRMQVKYVKSLISKELHKLKKSTL